jgi:hypothetical protein
MHRIRQQYAIQSHLPIWDAVKTSGFVVKKQVFVSFNLTFFLFIATASSTGKCSEFPTTDEYECHLVLFHRYIHRG